MRGSRIVVPWSVRVTLHVHIIRKDGTRKMVLDIDGSGQLPNVHDLQEGALLAHLPDADDRRNWRLMTAKETNTFMAEMRKDAHEPA